MQTYSLQYCTQTSIEHGLSAEGVMRAIYTTDGESYSIAPRMVTREDDDPNDPDSIILSEVQDRAGDAKVWQVTFHNRHRQSSDGPICFGATEDEAEADFLKSSFEESRYDTTKWFVEAENGKSSE